VRLREFGLTDWQPQSDEILMIGWDQANMVVARIPKCQLASLTGREPAELEGATRIAALNVEAIEQVVASKYARGEYHADVVSGRCVVCVHIETADILETGQTSFDLAEATSPLDVLYGLGQQLSG
jgi:hypothetical protein